MTSTIDSTYNEAELCEVLPCSLTDLRNWRKTAYVGHPLYLPALATRNPDGKLVYEFATIKAWLLRNPAKKERFLSAFVPDEIAQHLEQTQEAA